MRGIIPDYGSAENPVDVTASVVEDGGVTLLAILKEVASIEGIDIALVIVSLVSPERLGQIEAPLTTLLSTSTRPMLFHSPGTPHESASRILMQAGSAQLSLPAFARAMKKLADYSGFLERNQHVLSRPKQPDIGTAATPYRAGMLDDTDALMDTYDIPRPAEALVVSASQAVAQAQRIGYPVALKVISDQIPHKTEAGALALSLSADLQVAQAFEQVITNAGNYAGDSSIDTVLVQKMLPPGRELMVGGIMDPDFGPMVMLGFGGIYVEILRDVTLAPAPLSLDDAHAMIDKLKGSSLLRGARGESASDLNALANLLVATSQLLKDAVQDIDELDFNPVIVYPEGQGVAVVDSLFVKKNSKREMSPPVLHEHTTTGEGG